MLFGIGLDDFCFEIGNILDLAVNLEANLFKASYSVSIQIKALRLNDTDDEILFSQVLALKDFLSTGKGDENLLLPTRHQTAEIYKEIVKNPVSEDKINYKFLNSIGYGKTAVSLLSLKELGLISDNNGILSVNKNAEKTCLDNSKIIRCLKEG